MKKIVKRAGLISGIILSAFVIGGCGKTVDLNDCVEVKVSGIDGKGKAEVTVDYDKMETLLAKELNIEVKDKDIENIEDLGSAVDGLSKIDQAENCVNFQVQPADNLKNGDKITVKSIIDEEKAKELGIKFKFSEIKKEVSGLQTAIVISQEELFKDVIVEFTGASPDAAVQIRNMSKDKILSEISFQADKTSDIQKGDTVTVTATIPSELEEQGYVFENTSKEYKVEKVDSYVQKFEDLPEEDLKKIMNQAKDMVEANLKTGKLSTSFYKGNELAGTMEQFDSISEPQLEKSYFCHMKDGITSLWETKNKMYITYSFNVTGMHMFGPKEDYQNCYIRIACEDLILTKEGDLQFDIGTMKFSNGYAYFDSFYTQEIASLKDNYEIEEIDLSSYQQ